jgi:hypothetical protein
MIRMGAAAFYQPGFYPATVPVDIVAAEFLRCFIQEDDVQLFYVLVTNL